MLETAYRLCHVLYNTQLSKLDKTTTSAAIHVVLQMLNEYADNVFYAFLACLKCIFTDVYYVNI